MLTIALIVAGLAGANAQAQMRAFLSLTPKTPGKFYDPNDATLKNYFKGVDDMDRICMDDGAALFPGQPSWEFLAFACDARQPDVQAKFPNFPGVSLINYQGAVIQPTFADYFVQPGCEGPLAGQTGGCTSWDANDAGGQQIPTPAECDTNSGGTGNRRCMRADLAGPYTADANGNLIPNCPCVINAVTGICDPNPACAGTSTAVNIAGYTGNAQSTAVVTDSRRGRYFWHACDDFGRLEAGNPDTVTCNNWREHGNPALKGFVEDVGVLTGTGHPGHRTASVDCDPRLTGSVQPFVHVLCMQVIGATPPPTPIELPLYIFRTKVTIFDDGNELKIDTNNLGPDLVPPAGLVGVDLLDWVCDNDPWATPNLVVSNAGPKTHGPYKAVLCTDPNDPLIMMPVDKQRFLVTRSTRPIRRFPTRIVPGSPATAVSDPESRKDVADGYSHYFNANAGLNKDGGAGTCALTEQLSNPVCEEDCAGQTATECYPEGPGGCITATGCNEFGVFDFSGDCNGYRGGSGNQAQPYQIRHWNLALTCDQNPTATQDCTNSRPNRLPILCLELDQVRGIIRGDPHFVSFSGGSYDVAGEAGGVYNIISDRHLQFNSEFVPGGRHATYMGSVAIMFNNHTIWWKASMDQRSRNEKALIDGKLLPVNEEVKLVEGSDDYWVVFAKKSKKAAPRLEVKVPGYSLKFTYKHAPRRQYGRNMIEANRYRPHYFDFNVVRTFEAGHAFHPHGLLGQTARFYQPVKATKNTHNGEGVIEGTVEDYRVSDQFGLDFKFNEFDPSFQWHGKSA